MIFFKNDWDNVLEEEMEKPYFKELLNKVDDEYKKYTVYPARNKIFSALTNCPLSEVKVVILGQDPYHEEGQAHGMSFSVMPGIEIPPSLKNIYKEIENEYGYKPASHGYLMKWAKQGVLLLNATLTVREHQANSHSKYGWQRFTDKIIEEVSNQDKPVVFLLWGRNAIAKEGLIDTSKHLVLKSVHPSPLSAYAGFFGNNHFKKANEFLKEHGRKEIDWRIDELQCENEKQ